MVSAAYLYEKTAKGTIHLRWYAKRVDGTTPLYNDTSLYRREYTYYHNISNTYRSQLYNNREGIPTRNLSLIANPTRYGYLDPYVNTTNQPIRPLFQNWTYITSERRIFHQHFQNTGPFYLQMADIEKYSKRTVRVSRQQNEDCRKNERSRSRGDSLPVLHPHRHVSRRAAVQLTQPAVM